MTRTHQLYEVERAAKDLDDTAGFSLRRERCAPLLESFGTWLDEPSLRDLSKSPTVQAIGYARSNRAALNRYLEAGLPAIDNNAAERALRPAAISRKNWLFSGSDGGGRTEAILFSVTATGKGLGIDPSASLRDVLDRVDTHPARRIAELLPDRWRAIRPGSGSAVAG